MSKEKGYQTGVRRGKEIFGTLYDLGVDEVTVYAFTKDNTKRSRSITEAYTKAVVDFLRWVRGMDISILAVGDDNSPMFPDEFRPFVVPESDRHEKQKLNFLVNYGWEWDLREAFISFRRQYDGGPFDYMHYAPSRHVSRIDLLIRWGGQSRLSGFPPIQTVYSDIYIVEEMWPDYNPDHVYDALEWYQTVDVTLGG
jgi:undecaprenyl diphosphate synthase